MFGERSSRDAYFFETAKRILQDSSISEEILRLDPLIIAFSIFSNLPDDNPIDFLCTSLTTLRWYRWKCVEAFGDNHSATSHYALSDQLKNRLNALAIQQDHLIIRVLLQGMSGWIGDGKIDPGLLDRLLRLVCEAIHGILVERPCLIAKILEPEDGAKAELLPFLFEYCPSLRTMHLLLSFTFQISWLLQILSWRRDLLAAGMILQGCCTIWKPLPTSSTSIPRSG